MRVFEQDALSDKQLLASVVEKLESHDEVLVKIATDGQRRHKSTGGAKGGKSAKTNFSNMNSEVQINNNEQNLLSTNNSLLPHSLNNSQVAGQNVTENAVPNLLAAISTAPNMASSSLCSTSTSACMDPNPVSSSVLGCQMSTTHGIGVGQARVQAPQHVSNMCNGKCIGSKTIPFSATGPGLDGRTETNNQAEQPMWQHGTGGAQQHTAGYKSERKPFVLLEYTRFWQVDGSRSLEFSPLTLLLQNVILYN